MLSFIVLVAIAFIEQAAILITTETFRVHYNFYFELAKKILAREINQTQELKHDFIKFT